MIGAGTGTVKTKAFYLPALAYIAEVINQTTIHYKHWLFTHELNYLTSIGRSFSEARKLNSLLIKAGKRKISIGAYYGDTPKGASDFSGD